MKSFLPKNRFNPFTRSLLLAVGVLVLGLLLCLGQSTILRQHFQAYVHWQPVMQEARASILGHLPLMPRRFGVLSLPAGGEKLLSGYYRNMQKSQAHETVPRAQGLTGQPTSERSGRAWTSALHHLEQKTIRFGLVSLKQGFTGLLHRVCSVLTVVLPAMTG
jgi:hypothetical protein